MNETKKTEPKTEGNTMGLIADLVVLNAKISWAQSNALGFLAQLETERRKLTETERKELRRQLRAVMGSCAVYTNQLAQAIQQFQAHADAQKKGRS